MPSKRRVDTRVLETNVLVPPFALAERLSVKESEETSASPRALSDYCVCRFIERAAPPKVRRVSETTLSPCPFSRSPRTSRPRLS